MMACVLGPVIQDEAGWEMVHPHSLRLCVAQQLDTKDGSVDIVRGFGGDAIDRPLSISFSKNNTVRWHADGNPMSRGTTACSSRHSATVAATPPRHPHAHTPHRWYM
jgi:hypothetical protein